MLLKNPLPLNQSAAVLKASRSVFQPAAAGLRHSRAPVQGFKARIGIRRILTPALSPRFAAGRGTKVGGANKMGS